LLRFKKKRQIEICSDLEEGYNINIKHATRQGMAKLGQQNEAKKQPRQDKKDNTK
jgi:hypothetical protein